MLLTFAFLFISEAVVGVGSQFTIIPIPLRPYVPEGSEYEYPVKFCK